MTSTRLVGTVLLAFVVGLVAGGVAVGAVLPAGDGTVDPERPPSTTATATGCIEQSEDWAFTAPAGPAENADRVFLVRTSVAHGADRSLTTRLEHGGDGRYQYVLTTTPAGNPSGGPDCQDGTYGSTVELAATLPGDFESVTVVYDGEQVGVVDNPRDRAPTFRPLAF